MEVREGEAIPRERVRVNGTLTTAKLSGDGELQWEEEEEAEGRPRRRRSLSVEREVLGVAAEGSRIVVRAFVEKENRWCCGGNRRVREREDFVFEPLSADSQRLWCVKIQECIDSLETQRQLHAKEIASSLDLSKYDGIVCVSGDGVLVEVVNGLLQREDWDSAIKIPLGIVSAGTGNGMAKSLLDSVEEDCSASNSTLAIIRGLVADIDIESEKYRWMGSSRLDFYALLRIINLRKYNGRLFFVPAPGYEEYGKATNEIKKFMGNLDTQDQCQVDTLKQHCYGGPDICLEALEWRSVDGPFISVWLHNVPWGSEDTMAAPHAQVKAFILEPGQCVGDPSRGGIIDSDGEVLARGEGTYKYGKNDLMKYGPVQITVDQGCEGAKSEQKKSRKAWRLRSGDFADLCDSCALLNPDADMNVGLRSRRGDFAALFIKMMLVGGIVRLVRR
ncbi:hypothetical protein Syun_031621 [Stephania yunnanensis]|uniref:DAGKc domain-containing protein n=1 Tax=Stephania yunnanensis TaxID=152371 RepID=A0AAP0E0P0_9MAGN